MAPTARLRPPRKPSICSALDRQVWDDTGSSNAEFAAAVSGCAGFSLREANAMEARFLRLVEYNLFVTRQLYTIMYFELRDLCEKQDEDDDEAVPLKPLAVSEVGALEAHSRPAQARAMRARSQSIHARS